MVSGKNPSRLYTEKSHLLKSNEAMYHLEMSCIKQSKPVGKKHNIHNPG